MFSAFYISVQTIYTLDYLGQEAAVPCRYNELAKQHVSSWPLKLTTKWREKLDIRRPRDKIANGDIIKYIKIIQFTEIFL